MFYKFDDEKINYIGRWGGEPWVEGMTSTANGSKITFRFRGNCALLKFNLHNCMQPYPHLWIVLDHDVKTEVPLDKLIRVEAMKGEIHTLEIISKSSLEMYHRWYSPLVSKVTFLGVEAEEIFARQIEKKTIEFVGDSITEGVLIDVDKVDFDHNDIFRTVQDDSTATYAYLTAKALDLEPFIMGYGAVGLTHGGCGAVPKCMEAYPYCFDGVKKNYKNCDYIVINHGANDQWGNDVTEYLKEYTNLLDLVISENPKSKVIVLSAFCGFAHEELGVFVNWYNREYNAQVTYIDTYGWIPKEPLHPLRDGHRVIAEILTARLREIVES